MRQAELLVHGEQQGQHTDLSFVNYVFNRFNFDVFLSHLHISWDETAVLLNQTMHST